jgi:putative flippase GtrA
MSFASRLTGRRGVRQFLKFGIVGASGTLVNFIIYHSLLYFAYQIWFAYAVGFIIGGINNYWWNRHWTFRSKREPWRELGQFIIVSAVALCISELVLVVVERHLPQSLAHRNTVTWLSATVVGMGWNFFVNKYWTFRHTHAPAPANQAGHQS